MALASWRLTRWQIGSSSICLGFVSVLCSLLIVAGREADLVSRVAYLSDVPKARSMVGYCILSGWFRCRANHERTRSRFATGIGSGKLRVCLALVWAVSTFLSRMAGENWQEQRPEKVDFNLDGDIGVLFYLSKAKAAVAWPIRFQTAAAPEKLSKSTCNEDLGLYCIWKYHFNQININIFTINHYLNFICCTRTCIKSQS